MTTLSRALAVAFVALLVALGGTSYAAFTLPNNSVSARQLKNKSVTPAKVAPRTIALFKGQKGDKGDAGPQGPEGLQGLHLNGSPIGGSVGLYLTDYATIPANGNASVPDSAIVHLAAAGKISNHCPAVGSSSEGNASVTAIKVDTASS